METKHIGWNDFETVCRICLGKNKDMISIFEITLIPNLIKTYREMLEECASVHISADDLLPKNICLECSNYLKQSYKLKIQYLSTVKLLEEIITNAQHNIKLEVAIDEDDDFKNEDNSFNFYNSEEATTSDTIKKEFISVKDEFIHDKEIEINDTNDAINDNVTEKHNKIKKYKCEECEMRFHLKTKLYKHLKLTHSIIMKCMYCDENFHSLDDVRKHSPEINRCKICKQDFGCKNILKEHLNEHVTCEKCGQRFQSLELCNEHQKTHADKFHLCPHCGKSFSNVYDYTIHVRRHTGEKPYHCTQCDSKFTDGSNFRKHSVTHLNERNFECEICKNKFKSKIYLAKHKKRMHVEERNYSCGICNKKFKTLDYLNNHQFVHTGERNFVCTYCNKAFYKKYNLQLHLRIHTGEKPFICTYCGKTFSHKHVLNGHMKTHFELSK